MFIAPVSPWENGHMKSLNGKLRDELLAREALDTLLEAKVLIELWRQQSNTIRSHSAQGGIPAPSPSGAAALRASCSMWMRIWRNRRAQSDLSFSADVTVLQDEPQRYLQNHKVCISGVRRFAYAHGVPVKETIFEGCRTQIGQPVLGQYRGVGITKNKGLSRQ